jgi:membrane protein insertase Oxa1/YidC/SpoIIIJ
LNVICLITRRRACLIILFITLFVILHDHLFLFLPYDASYCFLNLRNHSILFSCDNAYYKSYGYTYSLTDLIFFESVGLNNLILPILIILTNILLIFGLRRRAYQRQHRLGTKKHHDWREQSVMLYVFLSCISFVLLTAPVGILNGWSVVYDHKTATSNVGLILDLMEILHHCTHFPILLMTSSVILIDHDKRH